MTIFAPPKRVSFIQSLNPSNRNSEKKKFLFDPLYNPQFEYDEPIDEMQLRKYGEISHEHFDQAKYIIDTVVERWGVESKYMEEIEGKTLTKDELVKIIREYLKANKLEGRVKIQFIPNAVSLASMLGDTLNIRTPITHRHKRVIGMLHHEIGTHFFRRINEEQQPWFKEREKFDLQYPLVTEEGLAALHAHCFLEEPYLWFPALYYYLVCQADHMTFAELNEDLKKYVDDRERRWNMCLRVKRGIPDTSKHGAFAKDQSYLLGANTVVKWLSEHDYDARPLYIGKIAIEDLQRVELISHGYKPALPLFLQGNIEEYKTKLQETIRANHLLKIPESVVKRKK